MFGLAFKAPINKKLISKIKNESELLLLNESIVDTKMIEDKKEL